MVVSANKVQLSGLTRKLVMDGLLNEATVVDHHQKALGKKKVFVPYLVENKLVTNNNIAAASSQKLGVPVLDINSTDLNLYTVKLVKEDLIKKTPFPAHFQARYATVYRGIRPYYSSCS